MPDPARLPLARGALSLDLVLGGRWSRAASALFARARKRGANHRRELITLLTPGQLKSAAFEAFPNCMTLSSFLSAIHRVDARFTQLGLCKR